MCRTLTHSLAPAQNDIAPFDCSQTNRHVLLLFQTPQTPYRGPERVWEWERERARDPLFPPLISPHLISSHLIISLQYGLPQQYSELYAQDSTIQYVLYSMYSTVCTIRYFSFYLYSTYSSTYSTVSIPAALSPCPPPSLTLRSHSCNAGPSSSPSDAPSLLLYVL